MPPAKSDERMKFVAEFLEDFSDYLSDAIFDLDNIMDKYEEGWEDRTLYWAIGLQSRLYDLIGKVDSITGQGCVDFQEAELVDEP